jgi:predicted deacylase
VFGFVHQSRYLPDRRDLNRCFPGSQNGSLASRLAHLFMREVVKGSDFGLDLHTGSDSRTNLPQVRGNLEDPKTRRCALAFGAPVMIHSRLRDGSLRAAASRRGIPVLLYEAGEASRFDEKAIRLGVHGVLQVLRELDMWRRTPPPAQRPQVDEVEKSSWVRADRAGILRLKVRRGAQVSKGESLGMIADPFGENARVVRAPFDGRIIGLTTDPVVYAGDAVVHLARCRPATP